MPRLAIALLAGLLATLCACAARADRIDGFWCDSGSQRLSIDGPAIVTPAGHAIEGNYNRHFFNYIAPSDEPSGGTLVQMRLLNEDTMQRRAGPAGPVETWHRCGAPVS